jgi:hypothetical protein
MTAKILFSLLSRRKLRQRTTRAAARSPKALADAMKSIESTLKKVFSENSTAVVQDVYVSYRVREGEYILLVELTHTKEREGLYVVKISSDERRLRREFNGWSDCRPDGLRHDLVLTTLEAYRDENGKLIALIYADADQIIGVDQTLSLEQAMLDCVRFGVPTPQSIADCLFLLYERLGLLLYRNSYTDDPKAPSVRITAKRLDEKLMENLNLLGAETGPAFDLRANANTAADTAGLSDLLVPPHLFARQVLAKPSRLVPRLRRGYAHGDLHGRNVLVGRIGDRVLWPAVFDYGDMGKDNLIGWDFVKLETEFKVRVYPEIFLTRVLPYAADILRLERDMDIETEACRGVNRWPESPKEDTPIARFRWLVLMIRRHAANHLELYCGRSREWLAEYYFLLALYGLNGIRFKNLTEMQRLAGYLSAGVASARYIYNLTPTGANP